MWSAIRGKALEVWNRDEELDEMYSSLFREFLTYMMEDPRNIGVYTHLLFMAKNIERIGDHATNIAEDLYYLVYGKPLDQVRPKGDKSSLELVASDLGHDLRPLLRHAGAAVNRGSCGPAAVGWRCARDGRGRPTLGGGSAFAIDRSPGIYASVPLYSGPAHER